MPLSSIQSEILRLLAAHRDPESYVGGATPLNRNAPLFSRGIDVFQDREERVSQAALNDIATSSSSQPCEMNYSVMFSYPVDLAAGSGHLGTGRKIPRLHPGGTYLRRSGNSNYPNTEGLIDLVGAAIQSQKTGIPGC